MQLCALRNVALFLRTGVDSNRDVEVEGEQRLCLCSFYFCLRRPLLGAIPSLCVVVAALELSLGMYE